MADRTDQPVRQASIERAREEVLVLPPHIERLRAPMQVWDYISYLQRQLADAERQRDEADERLAHSERLHTQWFNEAHELSRKLTAAEAALVDTQARNRELLDAIEAFADATAVAAGNILRPPRED